jgi:hypothetical protein
MGKKVGIGVPLYAGVLRAKVSSPATIEATTMRWDPLGKDRKTVGDLMDILGGASEKLKFLCE